METKVFYKSKTFQGLLVTLIALALGKGTDLGSGEMQSIAEFVTVSIQILGLAYAAYGRVVAETKLRLRKGEGE